MDIRPAALLACFLAAPTLAQAAEGIAWRAFADGSACHMESASGPRLLRISAQAGEPAVTFRISRAGWRIPRGEATPVVMQVDRQAPILVRSARGAGEEIRFTVDRERFAGFAPQFSAGATLRLAFPGGDEPAWSVPLRGSSDAAAAFRRCLRGEEADGPQPFGRERRWEAPPPRPFQLPL